MDVLAGTAVQDRGQPVAPLCAHQTEQRLAAARCCVGDLRGKNIAGAVPYDLVVADRPTERNDLGAGPARPRPR